MEQHGNIKRFVIIFLCSLIRIYQYVISPMRGPCCRFYPSCSSYAYDAFVHYGPIHGLWLTIKRLLRCHPWHSGGFDPIVPNLITREK